SIAAHLCGADVVERVIDPTLADFRFEREEATRLHRPWRRRWLRVALSISLAQVILVSECERLWRGASPTRVDEDVPDSMLTTSLFAIIAALALFMLPALSRFTTVDWRLIALFVPQAVPVAIPIGLTFGVLASGRASKRLTRRSVPIAIAACAVSFVTLGWIVPDSNQRFRERAFARNDAGDADASRPPRPLARGPNELTIVRLKQQMRTASPDLRPNLRFSYYVRWTLPSATIALVLFALAAIGRWELGRVSGSILALSSCFVYWLLMEAGRQYALAGIWPSAAGAWLPNIFFTATAGLLVLSTNRRRVAGARSG